MPRRRREQTEQAVFPSGTSRLTMEYVSSRSITTSTPCARRYASSRAAGKPGCPWSRLQATSENFTGARRWSCPSAHSSVKESLPPEIPTKMRSPSSIMRKSAMARPASRNRRFSSLCFVMGAELHHLHGKPQSPAGGERPRRAVRRRNVHRLRHLPRAARGNLRQLGQRPVLRAQPPPHYPRPAPPPPP